MNNQENIVGTVPTRPVTVTVHRKPEPELDETKYKELKNMTVRELITILEPYADKMVLFDMDIYGHLHVAKDGSYIDLDSNSLENMYEEYVEHEEEQS